MTGRRTHVSVVLTEFRLSIGERRLEVDLDKSRSAMPRVAAANLELGVDLFILLLRLLVLLSVLGILVLVLGRVAKVDGNVITSTDAFPKAFILVDQHLNSCGNFADCRCQLLRKLHDLFSHVLEALSFARSRARLLEKLLGLLREAQVPLSI